MFTNLREFVQLNNRRISVDSNAANLDDAQYLNSQIMGTS
jgi:hypothetical protein